MGALKYYDRNYRETDWDQHMPVLESLSKRPTNRNQLSKRNSEIVNLYKKDEPENRKEEATYNTLMKKFEENFEDKFEPVVKKMVAEQIEKGMEVNGMLQDDRMIKAFQTFYSITSVLIATFFILLVLKVLPIIPSLAGLIFSIAAFYCTYRGENIWRTNGRGTTGTSSSKRR